MKKQLLLILFFVGFTVLAQKKKVDQTAVTLMDRMSTVIGELQSCSYTLSTATDKEKYPYGVITEMGSNRVQMAGPDKMLIHARQGEHHKGYWYNGDSLTYYSFDENNYVKIPTPGNIISTIDSLKETYHIDFPAADFFYPTFTDDVLDHFEDVRYVGEEEIDNKECFHIKAENDTLLVQLWITDDAYNLPLRFSIFNKQESLNYIGTFSDWELNPVLPDAIFDFTPPSGARLIAIMSTVSDESSK